MTKSLYLTNTYLFESPGIVTGSGIDDKGPYLLLDETIFYPQGGGQPADQGVIDIAGQRCAINFVRQQDQEIRHYWEAANSAAFKPSINTQVRCSVNQERRLLNARYHTAAHLIGNIAEMLYLDLKAVKGHSFPNEAYVEFTGESTPDLEILTKALNLTIENNLPTISFEMLPKDFEEEFYALPYPVPANKAFRIMRIGDFMPVPCGGTHVRTTGEIGKISIRKISRKADRLKISYDL